MSETMVDSNNNSAAGKYSLRPRSESKKSAEDCVEDDAMNLQLCKQKTRKTYRQRSQPLSKYRRRSANARERSRMREINEAFETLRRMVSRGCENQDEKTTKISTLRLAMGYIAALSDALRSPKSETEEGLKREVDESSEPQASARLSGRHHFECEHPSKGLITDSRNACGPNGTTSVIKSNVLLKEPVHCSKRCKKSILLKTQTNSKCETLRFSTDDYLQEASLSLIDDYVSEISSSLPRTVNNLVDELNCDFIQSTKETVDLSDVSPTCPIYYDKTIDNSSTSHFCEKNDHSSHDKTEAFEISIKRGSPLDSVHPEYEYASFLPVDDELGSITMNHVSFEELFNS